MEIHYNKKLGILFAIVGGLLLIIELTRINFSIPNLFAAVLGLILGISLLKKVYFIVEEKRIVVSALLGPAKKIYEFNSIDDVIVENNKIYIKKNNEREKTKICKFLADKDEWNKIVNKQIDIKDTKEFSPKSSHKNFLQKSVIFIFVLIIVGLLYFNRGAFDPKIRLCMAMPSEYQSLCVSQSGKNANICLAAFRSWDNKRGSCIDKYAQQNGDASACDLRMKEFLRDTEEKINKKDECLKNIAYKHADVKICEKISSEKIRNSCYYILATEHKLIQYCDSIVNDNPFKKDCVDYAKVKINLDLRENGNIQVCENIAKEGSPSWERDNCLLDLIDVNPDPVICDKMFFDITKENCYVKIARILKSSQYCEKIISNEPLRKSCIKLYQENIDSNK